MRRMGEATLNPDPGSPAGALSARIREAAAGTFDLLMLWLGDRLGFYRTLADGGEATAVELAERTGTQPRLVREWLEHQAVSGVLDVDDASAPPEARRYRIPEAAREALTDPVSLSFATPVAYELIHAVGFLPSLEEAFRHGGGLENTYGWIEGRPDGNRARYVRQLGSEWIPSITDIHERLSSDPPAHVADFGVGSGWSSIAMALAYPTIRVDGFDLDDIALGFARRLADEHGVADRVTFQTIDATDYGIAGPYELVTVFEALHDMARPVDALRGFRGVLADGGAVVLADERVPERFSAPGSGFDRYIYGWSVMGCLPSTMTDPQSAATGAVMRPETLERYAREAGFARVEILPIEHFEWRFYRLFP
jgi:2-polyprenyl-3-methyl-5-hydroxy-6-metoxy-1,4-benzoquinol methylase